MQSPVRKSHINAVEAVGYGNLFSKKKNMSQSMVNLKEEDLKNYNIDMTPMQQGEGRIGRLQKSSKYDT